VLESHLAAGRLRFTEVLGRCSDLTGRQHVLQTLFLLGIPTQQLHRVMVNWCTEDCVLNVAAINMSM